MATGIVPDVERNLAYAVDLVVELGVDDPGKGKPPQPADYTALVVGSRSSAIPIGTLFHDPKLSDFLPAAAMEGAAPQEVAGTGGPHLHRCETLKVLER